VIHPTSVELSFGSLKPTKEGRRARPVVWQLLSPRSDCLGTDRSARRWCNNKLAGIGGEHGLWSRCIALAVGCATSHHNFIGTVLASLDRQKKGPF
jgi:hypothetical protein